MYLGIDFLLDDLKDIYLSEVNTGLPGGASEYDLISRTLFGRPSGVFGKIEYVSESVFKKPFQQYLRGLAYFNELKALKIWMDGKGPVPAKPFSAYLRLEDKWVQFLILKKDYPVIPAKLFNPETGKTYSCCLNKYASFVGKNWNAFILKRRFGRGGAGFIEIKNEEQLEAVLKSGLATNFYIAQPLIKSSIDIKENIYKLSIRVIVFAGNFICMFANLAARITSNHGIRFYINPSGNFGLENPEFNTVEITEKAWEAKMFYGDNIPEHLYHNLYEEEIADTALNLPQEIVEKIKNTALSVGKFYMEMDHSSIPECYLEE